MKTKLTVARAIGAAAVVYVGARIAKSVFGRVMARLSEAEHAKKDDDYADEAARESFPASDPPSWTPTASKGHGGASASI